MGRGDHPKEDAWQDWFAAEHRVDRRFYHSFPRIGRRTADEITRGLAILGLILKYGFLLTPETHELRQVLNNPRRVQTTWLVQQRFCLTELHPSEVPWHAVDFGRFALEFDIGNCRSIGAMPALYFNQSRSDEGGKWYFETLLNHLAFIREKLLWQLINLGDAVDHAGTDGDVPVQLADGVTITASQASSVLNFLGVRNDFDPHELEGTIRLVRAYGVRRRP